MTKTILAAVVAATLALGACGEGGHQWPQANVSGFISGCLDESDYSPEAKAFCLCLVEEAQARWSLEEYLAKPSSCNAEMVESGAAEACASDAGFTG